MKQIHVGLIGLGTVGQGVLTIIREHQKELNHKTGYEVLVQKILVRSLNKKRPGFIEDALLTLDPSDLLDNPDIDLIIEVAGGVDTALAYIEKALKNHKHVITANKDLMAAHGAKLLNLARDQGCDLFYEASVGGGIPIIRTLTDGLSSDKIREVIGIINGTTNYILTKMDHEGMSYEEALSKAQALGFAEADPTSDVGGLDAGRKMAILGNLAFSMPLDVSDVRVKGIENISDVDISYGKKLGYELKLLGIAKRNEYGVEVSVEPTFLPHTHPLTSVHDEYNAVFVRGEAVGETMFYGPGAGSLPTATAIVSDVVTVIKNMALHISGQSILAPRREKKIKPPAQIFSKYYLRLRVEDTIGVFAEITALFAKKSVSFEKIIQEPDKIPTSAQIMIVTHEISLEALEAVLSTLEGLKSLQSVESVYRIENA